MLGLVPFFWKPFHKPPQKFENRAMGAFWEICISVPWVVTLLSGAASFIFANRINVMFWLGDKGIRCKIDIAQKWEMRNEKWEMKEECYTSTKNIWLSERGGHISVKRSHCLLLKWYIFVVPNFLLFSTLHRNLASYEVLSWFLSPEVLFFPKGSILRL